MSAPLRQAVGVLVVAILAGSPAAAAVCEWVCATPAAVHAHATPAAAHHHASPGEKAEHGQHALHERAQADAVDAHRAPAHARLSPRPDDACCDRDGSADVSLAAGRAGTQLTAAPPISLMVAVPAQQPLQPSSTRHRGPPGGRSTRTALPLRI